VPKKLTALHYSHIAAGAFMADTDGWQRPKRYREVAEEVTAAQERVGLADISPIGKLDLKGTAAATFAAAALRWATPCGAGLLPGESDAALPGAAPAPQDTEPRYETPPGGSPAPRDAPSVNTAVADLQTADGTIPIRCCRLAPDHLLLFTPPEHAAAAREALAAAAAREERAHLTDVTSVYAGIALLGPSSRDVLRKLIALDIRPTALPDSACAETALAGVHALLLRADLGGLPAFELYVTRDVAEFVWETLLDAGREYGLAPIGTLAYRALRSIDA
jgi:sarcosine oxidase subunit alpha